MVTLTPNVSGGFFFFFVAFLLLFMPCEIDLVHDTAVRMTNFTVCAVWHFITALHSSQPKSTSCCSQEIKMRQKVLVFFHLLRTKKDPLNCV